MSQTAITNIRIFSGTQLLPPSTLIITGPQIAYIGPHPPSLPPSTTIIDGQNYVLLPGLIDSHIHLTEKSQLKKLAQYGVTTALDMAMWPKAWVDEMKEVVKKGGVADFRTVGSIACAEGSKHSMMPGMPRDSIVSSPEDAARFVKERVDEEVDYIKIIADLPGFDQATLNALVSEAKKYNKLTIAHAASQASYERATLAQTPIITHIPSESILSPSLCATMKSQSIITVPTLTMMYGGISNLKVPGWSFTNCLSSIKILHEAGIPILAGTDANDAKGAPANVKHGEGLHDELGFLVQGGLGAVEALRAATEEPARLFGLGDRGRVEVGLRADLVLVEEDPIVDIVNTRKIVRVWCAGVEVEMEG